jgi:hypothetical protein
MNCNLNRSMSIGFVTMLIMGIIILIWLNLQDSTITYTGSNILLFAAVLFIIGTSMDYFNQCYTTCRNAGSSITFGIFTIALIYLFFSIFISQIEINSNFIIAFIINVLIISGIHYITCENSHKNHQDKSLNRNRIMSNRFKRYQLNMS